ncbi:MAG TPA: ClpXP protease specificity-enhancing factor [Accumulibacter sp.]|mgnify:CR=1 FL=1|nr:ClpXP protease specificity-enhancing factor [Accumulibacter sp.]HMW18772.1 ClpXP protease specificity-enhancing factor [Accumulibacter sp.]HMX23180.1 ClpXP protease specificity-enhancing factor [Accumulibacter sp.]HMY06389.1 ClpXP protease specificity-enhancing factor [Accumulibacter sp.]HNC19009.1 ClpXP protease specificity-enhancing factor [Accumulibacter sp.]
MSLPSTKPYLIRAIHQWCCDHGFTPYLSVIVNARTRVPREYVRDGQIVLNVGYEATGNLSIANDGITFQARFGGVARDIVIPINSVSAIYARENGAGMAFDPEDEQVDDSETMADSQEDEPEPPNGSPPSGRARLHRVK